MNIRGIWKCRKANKKEAIDLFSGVQQIFLSHFFVVAEAGLPAFSDVRFTHAGSDLFLEGGDTREFVDVPHLFALVIVEEFLFVRIGLVEFHHPCYIDLSGLAQTVGVDGTQVETIADLVLGEVAFQTCRVYSRV